ncbi:MAG: hypothetical protein QOE96_3838 [Blastocatellia bacterium]|jgi:hypothetical protein|nr:hypothetical protein [Blastocatellia bacterium]
MRALRIATAFVPALALIVFLGVKLSARHNETAKKPRTDNNLIVHEWGTFTSIAGKDGIALEWRPLNGPPDLPKFVHTIQERSAGLRDATPKADLTAKVRMETPVIYFYSNNEMDVSVKIDFPKGKITEWYPQARLVSTGINWGRFKVTPGAALNLPAEYSPSHYFAARETDSALIQVCSTDSKPAQQEKFLFYRGVGTFDLPLSVKLAGDKLLLKNVSAKPIAHLILFENRGGKIGYRLLDAFAGETTSERPTLNENIDSLIRDLKQTLIASGLYEKEADAMIKTWRTSWFEEGMRIFYVLPRETTDQVLPIEIDPQPTQMVRVLVGRAEIITPETEQSVQRQVSRLGDPGTREDAMRAIRSYGRFSEPILKRILLTEKDHNVRDHIRQLIDHPSLKSE